MTRFRAFHQINTPVIACIAMPRLTRKYSVWVGAPKMSPVWAERFKFRMRVPSAAVRVFSTSSTAPLNWSM